MLFFGLVRFLNLLIFIKFLRSTFFHTLFLLIHLIYYLFFHINLNNSFWSFLISLNKFNIFYIFISFSLCPSLTRFALTFIKIILLFILLLNLTLIFSFLSLLLQLNLFSIESLFFFFFLSNSHLLYDTYFLAYKY